jgi:hypothetical protein
MIIQKVTAKKMHLKLLYRLRLSNLVKTHSHMLSYNLNQRQLKVSILLLRIPYLPISFSQFPIVYIEQVSFPLTKES